MASQSTFVLKADTSSFLKSIQEAQTRLLGIEKEVSTSYQQILAAQAEVNRLQASQRFQYNACVGSSVQVDPLFCP